MEIYDISLVKKCAKENLFPLGGDMAEDLIFFLNKECKYICGKWWKGKSFNREKKYQYLSFKGVSQSVMRPICSNCLLLATVIAFDIYTSEASQFSSLNLQDKACKLIRSIANNHEANKDGGWTSDASADIILAGWLLWDMLNVRDKMLIINLLESEAKKSQDYKITYSYNIKGEYLGKVRVKELCQRAIILQLAIIMMPKHRDIKVWEQKLKKFLVSAFAKKENLKGQYSDLLQGYNIEDNGLLAKKISPIDQTCYTHNLLCNVISALAGEPQCEEALLNAKAMYEMFSELYLSKKGKSHEVLYAVDHKGKPKAKINDMRGDGTLSCFYAQDVFAYCFKLDEGLAIAAREWAMVRMQVIKIKQSSKGYYFKQSKGNINNGREEINGGNMAKAFIALVLKANGKI